jgi:organic radical activating enzyme
MKIPIAEIFESIQFEGSQHGRHALFVRLAGCNLWNGLEKDRDKGKGNCALYCDTDFKYQYSLTIQELRTVIDNYADSCHCYPLIIFTGGEPTLHNDKLIDLFIDLLDDNICVSLETNGTKECSITKLLNSHNKGHVTVSPKKDRKGSYNHIELTRATDLKLVFPYNVDFDYHKMACIHWYIQMESGEDNGARHLEDAIKFMKDNTMFRLSVQTHKYLGLR